jgi:hypothetical protein
MDYYDNTLLYCLDDGNVLLEGPGNGSGTEPAFDPVLPLPLFQDMVLGSDRPRLVWRTEFYENDTK